MFVPAGWIVQEPLDVVMNKVMAEAATKVAIHSQAVFYEFSAHFSES